MADARGDFRGILYVFDSLRLDNVGCYGHDGDVTPSIDAVAVDGSRFDNAYAQAIWTYPSAGSIFTGLYPRTHGSQQFDQPLNPEQPHIADGFADTDITTACFSTTLGVSPARGFEQQFDEFHHIGDGKAGLRPDIMDRLNAELLPWVKRQSDSAFFIVVWAMGTHHPYRTPETTADPTERLETGEGTAEWLSELPRDRVDDVRALYDDAVAYSDETFGDLIDVLHGEGIYDETTIFVTSDHGEIFDEHGRYQYVPSLCKSLVRILFGDERCRSHGLFDPGAFLGHQDVYPYEELINVPLVIKPGRNRPDLPEIVDETVELIDLLPTVYEFADCQPPVSGQGTSIFEYLATGEGKEVVFTRSQVHKGHITYSSAQTDRHKFCLREMAVDVEDCLGDIDLRRLGVHLLGQKTVLLDLTNGEERVADDETQSRLRRTLHDHVQSCDRFRKSPTPGRIHVDAETERHLAELGYK